MYRSLSAPIALAATVAIACSASGCRREPTGGEAASFAMANAGAKPVPSESLPSDSNASETAQPDSGRSDDAAGPDTVDRSDTSSKAAASKRAADTTVKPTPIGSALETIFSPARAPRRKTMGLLQRSFLDIAAGGNQALEVAIVVDGTDSMAEELAGIRQSIDQMLTDLRRYRNDEVRAAIVVYRDSASPSGPVSIPLRQFSSDRETIAHAVAKLQPESGAPYFHELPDLGIHKAIQELPWTPDDQVGKWILLFGDSPPYSESRGEGSADHGHRRFGTSLLIAAAKAKNIRIHCLLCTSSEHVVKPYEASIGDTRTFMSRLSGATDGLMLDLSHSTTQTALLEAAKHPEVEYAEIKPITAIDLASVRRDEVAKVGQRLQTPAVRVAVLPHLPLGQVRRGDFRPQDPGVLVSTALRARLSAMAGFRVVSPVDVRRQLRRLRSLPDDPSQTLRGLAARLGADYVIWGEPTTEPAGYQTAAYRRDTGERLANVSLPNDVDAGQWAHRFLKATVERSGEDETISRLLADVDKDGWSSLDRPMSESRATSAELLKAMETLQSALEYDTPSDESMELLAAADRACTSAATAAPRNPMAHWLRANIAYNQAANEYRRGETAAANESMKASREALNRAVDLRDKIDQPAWRTEVEADYFLLVERDTAKAIELYQSLTSADQPLASQLRGHWMLAGILAGDWGSNESDVIDMAQARHHVIQVMANWPESPQARLLRRWLRYDETSEQTEFNYLPMVNRPFLGV